MVGREGRVGEVFGVGGWGMGGERLWLGRWVGVGEEGLRRYKELVVLR